MLIEITEPNQAGEARRRAVAYAEHLKMGEASCGEIALATTEIATNLVKHGGGGYILLQSLRNGHPGMRLMGVDRGSGIADIGQALEDGHSTSGTLGKGLGVIRRVSSSFDLYSMPGAGTVVSAEFWTANTREPKQGPFEVGVVSEPLRGEDECGDGWGVRPFADGATVTVVDGLGHGVLAAEAAKEAIAVLEGTEQTAPIAIIEDMHAALKKTRGAAAAVARIELDKRVVRFCGVGNISASIVTPGLSRGLASHNGTVGQHTVRAQEFTVPWNHDSVLVMHSDGLSARWDIQRYPGILSRHASVIAAVLHRDCSRLRDDATVMVVKTADQETQ